MIEFEDYAISVHTVTGQQVGDIPCRAILGLNWGRESTEVSTCDITINTPLVSDVIEGMRPLHHWVTVWGGDSPVWTGLILAMPMITKNETTINCRDSAALMWRTRLPITRTWADTSPAGIAATVWQSMFELHRIRTTPVVLEGVVEESFTVHAEGDSRMVHQFMDDLVKLGLVWTVVAGRPVLGRFPREPIAELQECDFLVELGRRRDGSQTFNDVRIQGQNWASSAVVELAGLRMQTIVSLDDMFGVSNIRRATALYAQESGSIRDELVVPSNASLHPDAPVDFDDLIPGKMFIVHTEEVSELMRLDQLQVSLTPERHEVQVTLVADPEPGEIAEESGGGTIG